MDTLATRHPLPADAHIVFDPEPHTYHAWGQPVARSTTRLVDECFDAFDAAATVDQHYDGWKANPRSKYYRLVHGALADGCDDAAAKQRVRAEWEALGAEARRLGTALHAHCERDLNGDGAPPPPELEREVALYEAFKASDWCATLAPYRTEVSVAYRAADGTVVCAGRLDAVFTDGEGRFVVVDWKRSKHALAARRAPFGAMGKGVASHLTATPFHRYSLQVSAYAVMLAQSQGIDAGDRLYLVRLHPSLKVPEVVRCRDLRAEAIEMLEIEHQRLLAETGAEAAGAPGPCPATRISLGESEGGSGRIGL